MRVFSISSFSLLTFCAFFASFASFFASLAAFFASFSTFSPEEEAEEAEATTEARREGSTGGGMLRLVVADSDIEDTGEGDGGTALLRTDDEA